MDQGHGLLDRFLYLFPHCLCPSTTETEAACLWFESHELPLKQVSDIFLEMHDAHDTPSSPYIFTEVKEKLKTLKDDFIEVVNDAIKDGNGPPKWKKINLLQRVAASIHVFNYTTAEFLGGCKPGAPP